nr:MAG TPA: tail tape measure protein [Caudoviricetes sp.]
MATELGTAYVQIIPSADGIKGMIEKAMGTEVVGAGDKAGQGFMKSFAGTVTKMIAAIGIGKVIKDTLSSSLNEGAALQQSLGGIETLFKGSADIVKGYAKEAYRTSGLSANAYMESVTGFSASLLQSLGGDTGKAAEIANMAMIDMSDNANKMGTSMESIQFAYQGFAKQNYTMLDNLKLGYGGTKEEMQRLLTDAQKLTGVKYDINNLSDVYQAIHAIQENLDITGTTAKEASTTFTGSFASMKAAAQNVLGNMALGEDLSPSLEALKETVHTFVFGNFIPMLKNVVKAIPEVLGFAIKEGLTAIFGESTTQTIINNLSTAFQNIKSAVGGIGDLFGGFIDKLKGILGISGDVGELGTAFEGITGAISTVTDWIKQFVDWINQTPAAVDSATAVLAALAAGFVALKVVDTVKSAIDGFKTGLTAAKTGMIAFNAIVSANPFTALIVGVTAVVAALTWFFTQTETGKAIWQGFTEFLSSAWTSISSFLIDTWNNIAQTATAIWEGIVSVATAIWSAITGAIMAVVQPFIDAFMGLWNGMSSGISQVFDGYVTYLTGVWEVIKSVFLGAILIIIDLVTLNFGQLGTDLGAIWDGISNGISTMWEGIKSIFSGAVSAIVGGVQATFNGMAAFLSGLWDAISGAAIAGWDGLVSGVQGIIDGLVSGAQAAWDEMSNAVSSLVSGITGIFDALWEIDLAGAGQAIMDGFLGGLKAAWGAVTDFVGGIANWIREHKGPIEYDRKLLIPAGNAIMDGFGSGLKDGFSDVQDTVKGIAEEVNNIVDKYLNNEFYSELDFNGNVATVGGVELTRQQTSQISSWNPDNHRYDPEDSNQKIELHTTVELDGKVVGKQITPYVTNEQSRLDKRDRRKRGES